MIGAGHWVALILGWAVKLRNRPIITDEQQALLDGVRVRLMEPGERARFDRLIVEEHYLGNAQWVGEQLHYVAEYQGQWVALMSWRAAAYKLKLREEWIGWSDQQKQRRLPLVVNNSRFLILQDFQVPNLASRVMKLARLGGLEGGVDCISACKSTIPLSRSSLQSPLGRLVLNS